MAPRSSERTRPTCASETTRDRGPQHVVILTGPLRRRQDGRQQALRGPRLHGRGQRPIRTCCATWPSWSPTTRSATSASPWCSTCAPATRRWRLARPWARCRAGTSSPRCSSWRPATRASSGASARRATAIRWTRAQASRPRSRPSARCWRTSVPTRTRSSTPPTSPHGSSASGSSRRSRSGARPRRSTLNVMSFGYKYGVPLESDLVFDVRFMENPFYIPELRQLDGQTDEVKAFVLGQPVTQQFLDFAGDFFRFAIPAYQSEGKTRLTVAIGCTGGFHRSVAIAEALAERLREEQPAWSTSITASCARTGGDAVSRTIGSAQGPLALAASRHRHQALAGAGLRRASCSSRVAGALAIRMALPGRRSGFDRRPAVRLRLAPGAAALPATGARPRSPEARSCSTACGGS